MEYLLSALLDYSNVFYAAYGMVAFESRKGELKVLLSLSEVNAISGAIVERCWVFRLGPFVVESLLAGLSRYWIR